MKIEYKFSYGNIFKYILNQYIIISCHLFFYLLLLYFVIFVIIGSLEYFFKQQEFISTIVNIISVSLVVLCSLYFITILFLPRKAIIYSNCIEIKRHFLNISYLNRGFNDEILIRDIIECKQYEGKRYILDRTGPYAVYFFNWDDLVQIKTNDNKCYLVPLQNANEFIKEVNECVRQSGDGSLIDKESAGNNSTC